MLPGPDLRPGRDWQPCANIANTRGVVQVIQNLECCFVPCLACSIASASVIACFGSVKSPFPAATRSDAALNSYVVLICRHVLDRSSSCQNTKNCSQSDPSDPAPRRTQGRGHFRNPCCTSAQKVRCHFCSDRCQPYAFAVIVSSPCPWVRFRVCGGARRKACLKSR